MAITTPLDRDLTTQLAALVTEVTSAFEEFDYARALERTESFFWKFCDDYVELVKTRAYGDPADEATLSAQAALALSLSVLLRLFAPFLPFVTEEVWNWFQEGSIHTAPWPSLEEFPTLEPADGVFDAVSTALGMVRREKTNAKRSMRTPVQRAVFYDDVTVIERIEAARGDLIDSGGILDLALHQGSPAIEITLAADQT